MLLGLVVEEAQGARMPASPVGAEVAPAEGVGVAVAVGGGLADWSAARSDGLPDPTPESVPDVLGSADDVGLLAGSSVAGVFSGRSQSTPAASSTSEAE